jgi:3D (Asp-Asp-Asp) domain-containing protein
MLLPLAAAARRGHARPMRRVAIVLACWLLLVVGGLPVEPEAAAQQAPPDAIERALVFDLPAPPLDGAREHALWATWYHVPRLTHDPGGAAINGMDGRALGPRLSQKDWCSAALEGTALVVMPDGDEVMINYAGLGRSRQVDCRRYYPKLGKVGRSRFRRAQGRYGDGAAGALVPYRTLAVDPRVVPLGTVLYVPAARGVAITLPDGSTAQHDGWFYAADRGGAIKGNHVDVFLGSASDNPFAFVKSKAEPTFAAYVIAGDGEPRERLAAAHAR